ncbi:MAG: DUF4832 domain-containing protein, partial [Candidatus Roizmanbacteria bacterium]|nr:DUF4832 domain-containing protein [Candidatus Roizmanbacteria bacterium]
SFAPAIAAQSPGDLLPGDVNSDFKVNLSDLSILLANFGKSPATRQEGNIAGNDTVVNLTDLSLVLSNFGSSASPTATPTPQPPTPTRTPTPTSPAGRVRVSYSPSSEDFANPERGFMKQSSIWLDQPLDATKIRVLDPADSLVWLYFRLDNYRDPRDGVGVTLTDYQTKSLEALGSGKGLDTVQSSFTTARSKGLKLVIRFIYNFGPGSNSDPNLVNPDVPLTTAFSHIDQLTPLINQNKDVIAAIQIGIVGHFGEWHSSKYIRTLADQKAIVDKLLTDWPKDRILMIRYPMFKQVFYGGPIADAYAFNQSSLSRIALHDDAFLKDDTDDGTFRSTAYSIKISTYCDNSPSGVAQCWRDYVKQDSRFTPVGGEASVQNSPRSDCPNAIAQMENMHWSFINNGFNAAVLNSWKAQGCWDTMRRRLGYRLVLQEALIPQSVRAGGTLALDVTLTNGGFASLFNPRPVFVVLQNATNRYEIPVTSVDPRRWEAGKDHTMTANVTVPANVAAGTYKLGLWLPDQTTTLRSKPAYSVRFANTNVWEPATGSNVLTNTFQVTN